MVSLISSSPLSRKKAFGKGKWVVLEYGNLFSGNLPKVNSWDLSKNATVIFRSANKNVRIPASLADGNPGGSTLSLFPFHLSHLESKKDLGPFKQRRIREAKKNVEGRKFLACFTFWVSSEFVRFGETLRSKRKILEFTEILGIFGLPCAALWIYRGRRKTLRNGK